MTKQEYAEYEQSVKDFFAKEGIVNLSTGLLKCPDCDVDFECSQCPKCGKDAGSFPLEPYFSWSRCECCGRPEGGNRMDASGWNPTTKEVQTYHICEDCEYYAEYGRLDDTTMMGLQ